MDHKESKPESKPVTKHDQIDRSYLEDPNYKPEKPKDLPKAFTAKQLTEYQEAKIKYDEKREFDEMKTHHINEIYKHLETCANYKQTKICEYYTNESLPNLFAVTKYFQSMGFRVEPRFNNTCNVLDISW